MLQFLEPKLKTFTNLESGYRLPIPRLAYRQPFFDAKFKGRVRLLPILVTSNKALEQFTTKTC